jgi:riboflavin kinase/FMN adenylyltransferase
MIEADNNTNELTFLQMEVEEYFKINQTFFELNGVIGSGNQIGRTIGFPTANLIPETKAILPKKGVYAVLVKVDSSCYKGMLNIGVRPTFGFHKLVIEVHLFNFNQVVYNHPITVSFVKKIREEFKFETKEDLINQLELDKSKIQELLNEM